MPDDGSAMTERLPLGWVDEQRGLEMRAVYSGESVFREVEEDDVETGISAKIPPHFGRYGDGGGGVGVDAQRRVGPER